MAYLDYKVTDWKRLYIPNEKVQEVMDLINTSKNNFQVLDLYEVKGIKEADILECVEPMSVSANDGSATIEIFNDAWDTIFTNKGL